MYLECQAVHLPLVHHLLNALFPLIVPNMPFLPRWTSISWHVPSFFPMGFCSYFMSCVARSHIFPKNIWCFDNSYVEWPTARATRVECSNKVISLCSCYGPPEGGPDPGHLMQMAAQDQCGSTMTFLILIPIVVN